MAESIAQKNNMEYSADIQWLLGQAPSADALNNSQRTVRLLDQISKIQSEQLPYTIGLFGGWGCGKTTFLAALVKKMLADKSAKSVSDVIYFNAWKYAGLMEIVPALIYKVLSHAAHGKQQQSKIISEIMLSLGHKYANEFGRWTKATIGINLYELYADAKSVKDQLKQGRSADLQRQINQYYTQVDRAHELLQKVFAEQKTPIVVIIDELDRCDPHEAFEIIKQLRIFFSMRGLPIVFILSANPDPIGLAIKHQYGLHTDSNDFETRRILEKFVDIYIDMMQHLSLQNYVFDLWREAGMDIQNSNIITQLDNVIPPNTATHLISKDGPFDCLNTQNPLTNNLRSLKKAFYSNQSRPEFIKMPLTVWLLENLKQVNLEFRRELANIAFDLTEIVAYAYSKLQRTLLEEGIVDVATPNRINPVSLQHYGDAFNCFQQQFAHFLNQSIKNRSNIRSPNVEAAQATLLKIRHNTYYYDYIILMSLLPLELNIDIGQVWRHEKNLSWTDFSNVEVLHNYYQMLSTY